MRDEDGLNKWLKERNSFDQSSGACYCEECCLPLADYGYNSIFIPKENDTYIIREYCDLCAAEYFGEEDYHSEILKINYENDITVEPSNLGGRARIRGMQTTVKDILRFLASGMSEKEILSKFPNLTHKRIQACLAFASDRV